MKETELGSALGRRYGKALFAGAEERGETDEVGHEIEALVELLEREPALRRYLASPRAGEREKGDFLARHLGARLRPLTLEFMRLLLAKRRLGELAHIATTYRRLLHESRGEAEATVVTARELEAGVLAELRERIGRMTGKRIILGQETDPALLGGMAVYVGGRVFDGTLRTRLDRLRKRLLAVRVH